MRTRRIPSNPRFGFATEKAYELLLEYGYDSFPISISAVLDELSDYVSCLSWTEAKRILKTDDPLHLKELKADGRVLRINGNKYLIVYDDTIDDDHHNSWTIMHEIGHVILGHLTEFNIGELSRSGLNDKEYEVLEKEAHYFAAEFLMPTAILRYFSISVEEIALLFDVSEDAAGRKYKRVFEASYMPRQYTKYEDQLIRNFSKFITVGIDEAIYKGITASFSRRIKFSSLCRKCFHCHSYINDDSAEYCPYCGETIASKRQSQGLFARFREEQELIETPGIGHIRYRYMRSYTIENNQKITKPGICPVCLNHQINKNSNFCHICGTSLYNKCPKDGLLSSYSGSFCPSCGRKTTSGNWYSNFEKRYRYYLEYSNKDQPELVEYPYWEYVKHHSMLYNDNMLDLLSSLVYSTAFIDDNDNIYIYLDNGRTAEIVNEHIDTIREILEETDQVLDRKIEVIGDYDIQ